MAHGPYWWVVPLIMILVIIVLPFVGAIIAGRNR